jgi:site-specific recombinase XerD
MSALAPTMQAFFTERLQGQRQASPHTIAAYRNTFRLLLTFAEQQTGKTPSQLHIDDLNVRLVTAFLDYLEHERAPRTDQTTTPRSCILGMQESRGHLIPSPATTTRQLSERAHR